MNGVVLYYECHVTVDPITDEKLLSLSQQIAARFDFRMADLFMQKRKEETPERSKYDSFFSSRDSGDDNGFFAIETKMQNFIWEMSSSGFIIRRYKIEAVILDSNLLDSKHLLDGYGGICSNTICSRPNATFWHKEKKAYVCFKCAEQLRIAAKGVPQTHEGRQKPVNM